MAQEDNKVVIYYDSIANQYDESRFNNSYGRFIDYEERRILDQLIKHPADAKCLEMACGTGRLTCYATHALDASHEMMKHAMARHPGVDFRQASAAETGFENEAFHTIYSFHLMMHLEPALIKDIIAEAHRILKPGGKFIFDIPSRQRRQLLHHKQESWHGGTHLSKAEVLEMSSELFDLGRTFGIMMLPIHKLPTGLRKSMRKLDFALANSPIKQFSSYIVYELIKR